MKITVKQKTGWENVLDCARTTIWKDGLEKEPSESFKVQMAISEHSPLREVSFSILIEGLKSWVATHLVRHHIGVEKYVSTQRDDRIKDPVSRDDKGQGEPVNMRISINAQALINTSRLRLCHCASPETMQVWRGVIREVRKLDPIIASACVPNCVYRGLCAEGLQAYDNCKYTKKALSTMRKNYVKYFKCVEIY